MDQIIADHGQGHGKEREHQYRQRRITAVQGQHGLGRQDLIEGIESDVRNERHAPHQEGTDVAELRPRLDHLRQAELRALGGMKSHEEGAERAPEKHGESHPQQMAAESDADHSGCNRRQVRVAGKPNRPQMPYFAVPLGDRHVVDRSLFDHQVAEFCRHVCSFILDAAENTNIRPPLPRRILTIGPQLSSFPGECGGLASRRY